MAFHNHTAWLNRHHSSGLAPASPSPSPSLLSDFHRHKLMDLDAASDHENREADALSLRLKAQQLVTTTAHISPSSETRQRFKKVMCLKVLTTAQGT